MKKIVDFNRIEEVDFLIKSKCDLLNEELLKMENVLSIIESVDKTDNVIDIMQKYKNEINEIRKFINVIDYYIGYMDKTSEYYKDRFVDYRNKLENNLMEVGVRNDRV